MLNVSHWPKQLRTSTIQMQKALCGNHSSVMMTKRLLEESSAYVGSSTRGEFSVPLPLTQEPPLPADLPECFGSAGTAAIYH